MSIGSTGIFAGALTKHIDPHKTVYDHLRFNPTYERIGFIRYDRLTKKGISAYKIYDNITYLHNRIINIIGKQPQIIKVFDIESWNFFQEQIDIHQKEVDKTNIKKKIKGQK